MSGLRSLRSAAGVAALILSMPAIAQEAGAPAGTTKQPGAGNELPAIVVETSKSTKQAKPKPAEKTTSAPSQQTSPATGTSQPDDVQLRGETALGPVDGVVATRSATGTKTDTPIVEIPRSVDVVTADLIAAQQSKSVRDALTYVPGVQVQSGGASVLDLIAVRGFTAPIYLNGLLLPTDTAVSFSKIRLEPYNLERLEI